MSFRFGCEPYSTQNAFDAIVFAATIAPAADKPADGWTFTLKSKERSIMCVDLGSAWHPFGVKHFLVFFPFYHNFRCNNFYLGRKQRNTTDYSIKMVAVPAGSTPHHVMHAFSRHFRIILTQHSRTKEWYEIKIGRYLIWIFEVGSEGEKTRREKIIWCSTIRIHHFHSFSFHSASYLFG